MSCPQVSLGEAVPPFHIPSPLRFAHTEAALFIHTDTFAGRAGGGGRQRERQTDTDRELGKKQDYMAGEFEGKE